MAVRVVPDTAAARAEAAKLLRAGSIVAVPTDTVYGIAAAMELPDAIERLFAAKGRPPEKAVAVLLADAEQAWALGVPTPAAQALAQRFWPGGLTLVLPIQPGVVLPRVLAAGAPTIGVRVPNHDAPRALARILGPCPPRPPTVPAAPMPTTRPRLRSSLATPSRWSLTAVPSRAAPPPRWWTARFRGHRSCAKAPFRRPQSPLR